MANSQKLAERIPAEYRKEILELNMIQEAQAVPHDGYMIHLGIIYKNYIDSTYSPDCNLCCGRVLDVFKLIQPYLIEMEKASNSLDKV